MSKNWSKPANVKYDEWNENDEEYNDDGGAGDYNDNSDWGKSYMIRC